MLDALQQGVRGGKWHTLIDKVYRPLNLLWPAISVLGNEGAAGVDHQTVDAFQDRQLEELRRLEEELRTGKYQPQAVRRVWIPKPGSTEQRPLGIPTVRDRVVQTALLHVLEPIFDVTFAEHSYGFRRGRGCHHALERIEALLNEGYVYVVDADLKSYFDTIPNDRLMSRVRERVSDSRVLGLVEQFLEQGVMDGLSEWTPITGTPQGAVIAPPTKVQNSSRVSPPGKKGEVDSVYDAHLGWFDHHPIDERSKHLAARVPVGLAQVRAHRFTEALHARQGLA